MKKYIPAAISFLCLVLFDQWTKFLACTMLKNQKEIPIIGDFFVLQYLENRGAAFGLLQGKRFFLLIITICILGIVAVVWRKLPENPRFTPLRILCVLLSAGAVGNIIDRLWRGYVVDFLYFKWINFPIFNVADCYVVMAVISLALLFFFYYKEEDFSWLQSKS